MICVQSVSAQVVHECDAKVLGPQFAQKLVDTIVPDDQRKFFTQNNLEKARKSFDTFCCKSGLLAEEECSNKQLYNDDQLVVSSPYLIEHLLRVVRTYVDGNMEECERYDVDCKTFLDEEAGFPGRPVCRRNGSEGGVGDGLCTSKYDIEKGVDQLISGTDPVMPGEIVGIFKKFWITGDTTGVPVIPALDERNPKEYPISHMLRRTCDELIAIVRFWNVESERQLGITYLNKNNENTGLSELELCNIHMKEIFQQNADYAVIGSQQRAVHALEDDRFVLMGRMEDLMNDMLDTVGKYANSVAEVMRAIGPKAAEQCSV